MTSRRDGDRLAFDAYARVARRGGFPSQEEEVALHAAHLRGDKAASERLLASCYLLVVRLAHRCRCGSTDAADLAQEGMLGALQALRKFDPSRGVRFASYAMFWARACMLKRLLRDKRIVAVGTTSGKKKVLYNLEKAVRDLEVAGAGVTDAALAAHMCVLESDVSETRARLLSPDVSADAGRARDLADSRPLQEELLAEREAQARLSEQLGTLSLTEWERVVLRDNLLAEAPASLAEIAARRGVTRERARQVKVRLVAKLRRRLVGEAA